MKRPIRAALPQEYLGSAVFGSGVYLVTHTEIVRYVALADEATRCPIEEITRRLGKVYALSADETGEQLLLVFRAKQVLYTRVGHSLKEIDVPAGIAHYLDRHRIFNLTATGVSVYETRQQTKEKLFKIKGSDKLGQVNQLVYTGQRVMLAGSRLVEMSYEDLFSEGVADKYLLFSLEDQLSRLSIVQTLRVKRAVLVCPEPITFIGEPIQQELFTEWGLVIVYQSGAEVYRSDQADYQLVYIYRCAPEVVASRASVFPKKKVLIKDKQDVVELTRSGPFRVAVVEATAKVFLTTTQLLVFSSTNYAVSLLAPITRPLPAGPAARPADTAVKQELAGAAERVLQSIQKYRELDYSLLQGRSEKEQVLLLEKILNSFKETATDTALVLSLSLLEKIKYLQDLSQDLRSMKQELARKAADLAERNQAVLARVAGTVRQLQDVHAQVSTQEADSPVVAALRQRIAATAERVKRQAAEFLSHPETRQTAALLRQQQQLLQRRVQTLQLLG